MLRSCPFFSQCFCECRSLCSLVCSRSSLPTNAARLSSREVRIASHAKTTPPCVMLCYVAVSLVALACLCFFLGLAPLDSMQPDSSSAVYIILLCLMCIATFICRASEPTHRQTDCRCLQSTPDLPRCNQVRRSSSSDLCLCTQLPFKPNSKGRNQFLGNH